MAEAHANHDEHDDYYVHTHVTDVKVYVGIFGALLALTALTVAAYTVRLGEANLAVAVIIATMKATLVGAWFMHLKSEQRFNVLFFLGSLLFVTVFFGYTFNDTNHRGRNESQSSVFYGPNGERAHGTTAALNINGEFQPLPRAPSESAPSPAPAAEEGTGDGAAATDGGAAEAGAAEAGAAEAGAAEAGAAEAGAGGEAVEDTANEAGTEGPAAEEGAAELDAEDSADVAAGGGESSQAADDEAGTEGDAEAP